MLEDVITLSDGTWAVVDEHDHVLGTVLGIEGTRVSVPIVDEGTAAALVAPNGVRFPIHKHVEVGNTVSLSVSESSRAIGEMSHADLVTLTSYMAETGDYSAKDIAYAVEKPHKFLDILADAKARQSTDG